MASVGLLASLALVLVAMKAWATWRDEREWQRKYECKCAEREADKEMYRKVSEEPDIDWGTAQAQRERSSLKRRVL